MPKPPAFINVKISKGLYRGAELYVLGTFHFFQKSTQSVNDFLFFFWLHPFFKYCNCLFVDRDMDGLAEHLALYKTHEAFGTAWNL